MAARRRRRRTVTVNRRRHRANTHRRRRTALATNRRHRGLFNPRRRHVRHRRRSNPVPLRGIVEGSIAAVAGMVITDFAQGLVPFALGGPLGKIGARLGFAYLVGWGAEKFGFAKYANLLAIGGAVGAAQDLLRLFMGGMGGPTLVPVAAAPAAVPGRVQVPAAMTGDDEGMSDIVAVPQNFNQLGDIVTVPQWEGYY